MQSLVFDSAFQFQTDPHTQFSHLSCTLLTCMASVTSEAEVSKQSRLLTPDTIEKINPVSIHDSFDILGGISAILE